MMAKKKKNYGPLLVIFFAMIMVLAFDLLTEAVMNTFKIDLLMAVAIFVVVVFVAYLVLGAKWDKIFPA